MEKTLASKLQELETLATENEHHRGDVNSYKTKLEEQTEEFDKLRVDSAALSAALKQREDELCSLKSNIASPIPDLTDQYECIR